MSLTIVVGRSVTVGVPEVLEGKAPEGHYAAVFEDEGDTGFLYALDLSVAGQPIQDALHIYNVAQVANPDVPLTVEIGWSSDSRKAALTINGYTHAVFDFEKRQGYCRTAFPGAGLSDNWSRDGHAWSEEAMLAFL